jgi:hypothetical protein
MGTTIHTIGSHSRYQRILNTPHIAIIVSIIKKIKYENLLKVKWMGTDNQNGNLSSSFKFSSAVIQIQHLVPNNQ